MTAASASTLASSFVNAMARTLLPSCYAMVTIVPMVSCDELFAAHAFGHGTAAEVRTVKDLQSTKHTSPDSPPPRAPEPSVNKTETSY